MTHTWLVHRPHPLRSYRRAAAFSVKAQTDGNDSPPMAVIMMPSLVGFDLVYTHRPPA